MLCKVTHWWYCNKCTQVQVPVSWTNAILLLSGLIATFAIPTLFCVCVWAHKLLSFDANHKICGKPENKAENQEIVVKLFTLVLEITYLGCPARFNNTSVVKLDLENLMNNSLWSDEVTKSSRAPVAHQVSNFSFRYLWSYWMPVPL